MNEEIEPRMVLHMIKPYIVRQVRPVLEREGMKPSYGPMLMAIERNPGCSLKEISDKTCVDKAMVTRTVSALMEDGFVEDRGTESRFYSLYITGKGKVALKVVEEETDKAWASLTGTLTEEEKESWTRIMAKFWAVIASDMERKR
jgi:DNA-binding MarR family transcriptional regulator